MAAVADVLGRVAIGVDVLQFEKAGGLPMRP